MRINGRLLRASNLRERRVLFALGVDPTVGLRVPRSSNPYHAARCVRRLARTDNDDMNFLRLLIAKGRRPALPTSPSTPVPTIVSEDVVDAAQ